MWFITYPIHVRVLTHTYFSPLVAVSFCATSKTHSEYYFALSNV